MVAIDPSNRMSGNPKSKAMMAAKMSVAGRGASFYHGTTHDVEPGGYIVPANQSGKSQWGRHGYGGQDSSKHAFATTSEEVGWDFANQAGRMGRSKAALDYGPPVDRVRLHTVAPNPQMKPGVFNSAHPSHDPEQGDLHEWVAPKFRSTGTVDIQPGRQGTFPGLNWNQFAHKQINTGDDANHPTDEEIHEGHSLTATGLSPREWSALHRERTRKDAVPADPPDHTEQLDLFSGKTVGSHADNDPSEVGDYHRNNISGMTLTETPRDRHMREGIESYKRR